MMPQIKGHTSRERSTEYVHSDRRKEQTRTARRDGNGKLATDSFYVGEVVTVRGAGRAVVIECPARIGEDYLLRFDDGERRVSWWVIDRIPVR